MFVTVSSARRQPQQALVVPQEAVIATGKRNVVIVAGDGNRFVARGGHARPPGGLRHRSQVGTCRRTARRDLGPVPHRLGSKPQVRAATTRVRRARPRRRLRAGELSRRRHASSKIGKDELTLSHGPIPALKWPSMTMGFKTPASGLPPGLKAGDDDSVRVRREGRTAISSRGSSAAREQAMIAALIRWSMANRFLVLVATAILVAWGLWAVQRTPLDALPDLSDTQVIIRTQYPGQAPQIVEDQVTYPLATTMMSVPGAKTVRGYSFFGDSFVYVLFEDGTDLYWARSRVLEYLNQVQGRLPAAQRPRSVRMRRASAGSSSTRSSTARASTTSASCARFRTGSCKYELKACPTSRKWRASAAWFASTRSCSIPDRLRSYGIPHTRVVDAIRKANQETGGSVVELGEAEYMVRARGYLTKLEDFRSIPLLTSDAGVVVRLGDVATRPDRSGDAARYRRARRRGGGRRRHRRHAKRPQRA